MQAQQTNIPRYVCYVYSATGKIIARGMSAKRDKAIRIAAGSAPKYYRDITVRVEATV